ncbi:MAG: hypothetical protein FJ271_33750 [Planctomycetes bacterium]|nr:hypothetical protein [Planctomycetota bacterium]
MPRLPSKVVREPPWKGFPDTVAGSLVEFRKAAQILQRVQYKADATKVERGNAARDFFAFASLVLRAYCLPKNWPDGADGTPREHVPLTLVNFVANQFDYLTTGRLPEPMADALKQGRHAAGPDEKRDMAIAAAYIAAARAGQVDDSSPIQTVARTYGIDPRTVKGWRKALSWVSPSDFFPQKPPHEHGSLMRQAMLDAGNRYSIAGRSAKAVLKRQRKRTDGG